MAKPTNKPVRQDIPRPGRGCRRPLGCLLAALVLLALIALLAVAAFSAADAALRSRWLSDLIITQIQTNTGLSAQAAEIDLTWGGQTTITGLTLGIPNQDEPTLAVEHLTLTHDPLVLVALTRGLTLKTVEARGVVLIAKQTTEADGSPGPWTVQTALDRLLASMPKGGSGGAPPPAPSVAVAGATVVLAPAEGPRQTIPISITADPSGPLGLVVDIRAEGLARARGNASMGAEWRHDVDLELAPDQNLWAALRPLIGAEGIEAPDIAARWTGRLDKGGLTGSLRIERAEAGGFGAAGTLRLTAAETVRIQPGRLTLAAPGAPEVEIRNGTVTLNGGRAVATGVEVAGAGQSGVLDGSFDLHAVAGDADIALHGAAPGGFEHQGHATLALRTPAGRPVITGVLETSGHSETSSLRVRADITAAGQSWTSLDIEAEFPTLRLTSRHDRLELDGLALSASIDPQRARIINARIPRAAESTLRAELHYDTLAWTLDTRLRGWEPAEDVLGLDVTANARGVGDSVEHWAIDATDGRFELAGSGLYDADDPKPLAADLRLHISQQAATDDADPSAVRPLLPSHMNADLLARFDLRGTLDPVELQGGLTVTTSGVSVGDAAIEDLRISGAATVTGEGGEFDFERFDILSGAATAYARTDRAGNIDARASLEGIDLAAIAALLGVDTPLAGSIDATIDATAAEGDLDRIRASGSWSARGLVLGPLRADSGRGDLRYADGVVTLDDARLMRADGELAASAEIPIADLQRVTARAEAVGYPFEAAAFEAWISGAAGGTLNLVDQLADVDIAGSADVAYEGEPVGSIQAQGYLSQRALVFESLTGEILGGRLTGQAAVPLDRPTLATADLTLSALSPDRVADFVSQAAEISGVAEARLTLAPAEDPHAPAPSRLDLVVDIDRGAWRTVDLSHLEAHAYIGPTRSVAERVVIDGAGGRISLWGSTNLHDGERYIQVAGDASGVDLAQIVGAVAPDAGRYEGRVSARFGGGGYLAEQHRLFGNATVTVTDSDLIDVPLVSELYSVLSVVSSNERRGSGVAEIQLEGLSLRIPRVQYTSRGVQVRASLDVADVFRGADSPIVGVGVGIARPLSGADTTITGGADRLLAAAQEGGSAVRIDGTLGDPRVEVVPLAELQSLVSRIFSPLAN